MAQDIVIHSDQINATDTTIELPVGNGGQKAYDHLWLLMTVSAMSGSETLDMYGKFHGMSVYRTAVLASQIDINAAASTIISQDLSGLGPIAVVKLVSGNIGASETIDCWLYAW